jgi:hypothetical protein
MCEIYPSQGRYAIGKSKVFKIVLLFAQLCGHQSVVIRFKWSFFIDLQTSLLRSNFVHFVCEAALKAAQLAGFSTVCTDRRL